MNGGDQRAAVFSRCLAGGNGRSRRQRGDNGCQTKCKALRGSALDPFGRTHERKVERELIVQYEARVRELLPQLESGNLRLAVDIAAIPLSMRGFGHVKQANVVLARIREAELLHRLDPGKYPAPERMAKAGQLRGIAVVAQ